MRLNPLLLFIQYDAPCSHWIFLVRVGENFSLHAFVLAASLVYDSNRSATTTESITCNDALNVNDMTRSRTIFQRLCHLIKLRNLRRSYQMSNLSTCW